MGLAEIMAQCAQKLGLSRRECHQSKLVVLESGVKVGDGSGTGDGHWLTLGLAEGCFPSHCSPPVEHCVRTVCE